MWIRVGAVKTMLIGRTTDKKICFDIEVEQWSQPLKRFPQVVDLLNHVHGNIKRSLQAAALRDLFARNDQGRARLARFHERDQTSMAGFEKSPLVELIERRQITTIRSSGD